MGASNADYERQFKEIVAKAKAAYGTGAYDDSTLEFLIPGLRESEDERIRKELVALFIEVRNSEGNEGYWHDLKVADILAWLEKQKEQMPAEWSEEDEKYLNRVINLWVNDFGEDSDTVKWLRSLRPSWKASEDEERLIKTSIAFLKDFADTGWENAVECIDWLKSKLK